MNKRILKKHCKRAVPYLKRLAALGHISEDRLFLTDRQDPPSWTFNPRRFDHKHRDRADGFCRSREARREWMRRGYIQVLKGTPAVGFWGGYWDKEWEDHSAFEWLQLMVVDHFTEWPEPPHADDSDSPRWHYAGPRIRCTSDVFGAAEAMLQEIERAAAERAALRAKAFPPGFVPDDFPQE